MMEKQKIDASTSDLNQDIIAMARAHDEACVQVFFVRNGKIVGREHFILEGVMDSTRESILGSFVKQFYMEQEYIPKEIIIEDEIEDSFIESEPAFQEEEFHIEDLENPNKDFYVKLNAKDDIIELYDSATDRLIETISGGELRELVKKLNMASGIFVNKKV